MTTDNILLVGAGGHALACIDVIESEARFNIQGLLGSTSEIGERRLGYPVLGVDADLRRLYKPGSYGLVCVGQIKLVDNRKRLFANLRESGYSLPTIISKSAWVSPHASIGMGSIIMHGAVVNAGADIGENCIINNQSLIEHGVKIGSHCHISTGALVNGGVEIGEGSFIGSGSQLREGIKIGQNCIVGLGSSIYSDLTDGAIFR